MVAIGGKVRGFFIFSLLLLILNHPFVYSQEVPESYSLLIEDGARMIRENDFERVLKMIQELPPFKKVDFKVRVLENFASLKGYLLTKNKEYGKKWQDGYKPMCYTMDKSATPILIELLKDSDPYMRAFTARALGFLGDHSALDVLRQLAQSDPNEKVRKRADEGYRRISGKKN